MTRDERARRHAAACRKRYPAKRKPREPMPVPAEFTKYPDASTQLLAWIVLGRDEELGDAVERAKRHLSAIP